MASKTTPVYNLTSFVGGISDYTDKGIAGSGQWSSGLEIRSGDDSLSCKQALVQESADVFEDLILWFVPAPDGNCYGCCLSTDQKSVHIGRLVLNLQGRWPFALRPVLPQ